ncbi:hypothetical protein [Allonocardiopsis opalescens]|uniref:Uncharacterized protein n=1 Tax=Allonocardiopsis opalescens TaxID=1144618 RepID=A0A2T0QFL9_9ACTN|nr:hypothetical protein [Allonocardiopsis opalescens]PRY02727.1 hypothetical protein CLV72_1011330 [Allonocardiopsis opalescens]
MAERLWRADGGGDAPGGRFDDTQPAKGMDSVVSEADLARLRALLADSTDEDYRCAPDGPAAAPDDGLDEWSAAPRPVHPVAPERPAEPEEPAVPLGPVPASALHVDEDGHDAVRSLAERLGVADAAEALLARTDLPVRAAVADYLAVAGSERLAGSEGRRNDVLRDLLRSFGGDHGHAVGAAAEVWAAHRLLAEDRLAPGSRLALDARKGERIALGSGTLVDTGTVPQADLVYRTADGVVHLDEVKYAAQTLADKLRKEPQQLERMLNWRAGDADHRHCGVWIRTDHRWTGLFSQVIRNGLKMPAIEVLIRNAVPVRVGERELRTDHLAALRDAVKRAFDDPANAVAGKSGEWFNQYVPDLDAARTFLRPYGADFL